MGISKQPASRPGPGKDIDETAPDGILLTATSPFSPEGAAAFTAGERIETHATAT